MKGCSQNPITTVITVMVSITVILMWKKNRQGFSLAASSRSTSAADLMPSWSSRESESFALCLYATNSVMANLVAPDIKHGLISHF